MGFEPTTRGLKGRCSNRAELWARCNTLDYLFLPLKVNPTPLSKPVEVVRDGLGV